MQLLDKPLTEAKAKTLQASHAIDRLLAQYDPVLLAQLFEARFNALPSMDRAGYKAAVSLMSPEFQGGEFDV